MSRIRLLPDDLIDQIAAGEVIERPASVVKELIENALDAGARSLAIDVEAGGRRRMRVADDGEGLDADDVLLALERHATSKMRSPGDLRAIRTFGFRGEALPAIASVSRLTLTSSTDGDAGSRVEVEGGRIRRTGPAGHPKGTTIDVRDLFFNTPARAKFLKSPQTELGHISELVSSCAVTIPSVAVSLAHEGRNLLNVAPTTDENARIIQLYGRHWARAIHFRAARGVYAVQGLVLPPDASSPARRIQHIYVNGRLVRDRLVGHAVLSACRGFLPKDRHAALFVFLACPPDAVDVNVHPTKAEVRFADSRAVHDLVQSSILEALRGDMPLTVLPAPTREETFPEAGPSTRHVSEPAPALSWGGQAHGSGAPRLPHLEGGAVAIAHYRESYIVGADDQGLLIIDQHAAHERILYEKLWAQSGSGSGFERQRLLFPLTVPVPRTLAFRMDETMAELDRLGISAEPFGDETLIVSQIPGPVETADLPGLIADLLRQMSEDDAGASTLEARRQKLIATVACHAAIKVRMPLTQEKMNYLIKELFRTQTPLKCPHGRPSVLRFPHGAIEKGFDRFP